MSKEISLKGFNWRTLKYPLVRIESFNTTEIVISDKLPYTRMATHRAADNHRSSDNVRLNYSQYPEMSLL